ncbi:MAG TPA: DUF1801 domain-containing protein [Acidimicrobiia bacterium]
MPDTIDAYISTYPADVQERMTTLRDIIHRAAPDVAESITYDMPTFKIDGMRLTYFAAWKRHIALYAIPRMADSLEDDLAPYRAAKDTVQFPNDQPLPTDLVERLLAALVDMRTPSQT